MIDSKAVRKYLGLYAEPEVHTLPFPEYDSFTRVTVVPALGEGSGLHRALESVYGGSDGGILVIVVLNGRASDEPARHAANEKTRLDLQGEGVHMRRCGMLWLVDRARDGRYLPEKQGVGLARKIGCDLALALIARGQVRSRWIHTTDADALVPDDYGGRLAGNDSDEDVAAYLYPFEHAAIGGPEGALAVALYECHLRYHVLGLRSAGSPYAWHAIGSTLAIDARCYAEVRGFPKRMAGEDFYILNKLAKVGRIVSMGGDPIRLSGRVSDRVPFGTGRAMGDLLAGPVSAAGYPLLNPDTFAMLGVWIDLLNSAAGHSTPGDEYGARSWMAAECARRGLSWGPLEESLDEMKAFDAVTEAVRLPVDEDHRRRYLHSWFDGFRTLKLLHALRDRGLGTLPFFEAIATAPFTQPANGEIGPPSVEEIRQRLAGLEAGQHVRFTMRPPDED